MARRSTPTLLPALALVLLLSAEAPAVERSPCPRCLRAGAATVALTVPAGTPLAGYGSFARRLLVPDVFGRYPHAFWFKPHAGRLDDISARALVLETDRARLVWIAVDLVAVDRTFTDEVTKRIAGAGGPAPTVIVSASHTHSGPGAFVDSRLMGFVAADRIDAEVREALLTGVSAAAHRADAAKTAARIGAVAIEAPMVTTGRLAEAPDREIVVLKVASTRGEPIALVWNYAIHGTMLGARNLAISGDVMGLASHELERALGVPALFVNGAVGDVSPREHGRAAVSTVARALASSVQAAWAAIEPRAEGPLVVASGRIELAPPALSIRNCLGRWVPAFVTLPLDGAFPREAALTGAAVGDTAWVTIPGELQSSLGRQVKHAARARWKHPFVAGVSNDYLGYLLEARAHGRARYVTCASVFGTQAGERVARAASELLLGLGAQR